MTYNFSSHECPTKKIGTKIKVLANSWTKEKTFMIVYFLVILVIQGQKSEFNRMFLCVLIATK